MKAFIPLYMANVREFVRDRSALFWTAAFPVMFILIFGVIFSSGNDISFSIGVVNEDAPHGTCRDRIEMRPVRPGHIHAGQADEGLVHQSGCLQGVTGALGTHVAPRQRTQFLVDERRKLDERAFVALAPLAKKSRYGARASHFCPRYRTAGRNL